MTRNTTSSARHETTGERYGRGDLPRVGAVVADPDTDSDETIVVAATHDVRADEFELDGLDDETVASYSANTQYPSDTPVVEVTFLNALQESYVRENVETASELREYIEETGFQVYPYPAARLGKTTSDGVISAAAAADAADVDALSSTDDGDDDSDTAAGETGGDADGIDADDLLARAMGATDT